MKPHYTCWIDHDWGFQRTDRYWDPEKTGAANEFSFKFESARRKLKEVIQEIGDSNNCYQECIKCYGLSIHTSIFISFIENKILIIVPA